MRWDPDNKKKALRALWVILHGDDACIASPTAQSFARIMAIVVDRRAFRLTVSEKKTEATCIPTSFPDVPRVDIKAACQK